MQFEPLVVTQGEFWPWWFLIVEKEAFAPADPALGPRDGLLLEKVTHGVRVHAFEFFDLADVNDRALGVVVPQITHALLWEERAAHHRVPVGEAVLCALKDFEVLERAKLFSKLAEELRNETTHPVVRVAWAQVRFRPACQG